MRFLAFRSGCNGTNVRRFHECILVYYLPQHYTNTGVFQGQPLREGQTSRESKKIKIKIIQFIRACIPSPLIIEKTATKIENAPTISK